MSVNRARPRVLFICGSLNQTTQMHQIAAQLPEVEAWFTPYYADASVEWLRRHGLIEFTIGGDKLRARCRQYLSSQSLAIDENGARGGYDGVVTCSDVTVPENVCGLPLVAVQEGILDPDGLLSALVLRFPRALPRWLAGTAATGLSGEYRRFCVASAGYRELFIERGAPAERVVVTGIPNFDDCDAYRKNQFPHRGYALVCTSDARETLKLDNRRRFIERALRIAGERELFVKLHPNENRERASRELARYAPRARVFATGSAEEMVANCALLITQYSSLAFVGIALGKPVHSYYPQAMLERLCPLQNRRAAQEIADVCREVFGVRRLERSALDWMEASA